MQITKPTSFRHFFVRIQMYSRWSQWSDQRFRWDVYFYINVCGQALTDITISIFAISIMTLMNLIWYWKPNWEYFEMRVHNFSYISSLFSNLWSTSMLTHSAAWNNTWGEWENQSNKCSKIKMQIVMRYVPPHTHSYTRTYSFGDSMWTERRDNSIVFYCSTEASVSVCVLVYEWLKKWTEEFRQRRFRWNK